MPLSGAPSSVRRQSQRRIPIRQASRHSSDFLTLTPDDPSSPRSDSTLSTVRGDHGRARERYCTVTVNDGWSKDEVLLNFDLVGVEVVPGSLMAITALKGDTGRVAGHLVPNRLSSEYHKRTKAKPISVHDQDLISSRYVFIAKDMAKEVKARQPDVEVLVAKHIADAFGMKKGSQVLLATVCEKAQLGCTVFNGIMARNVDSWMTRLIRITPRLKLRT